MEVGSMEYEAIDKVLRKYNRFLEEYKAKKEQR
jgi:ribosome-associated translation inhibitor RaiA